MPEVKMKAMQNSAIEDVVEMMVDCVETSTQYECMSPDRTCVWGTDGTNIFVNCCQCDHCSLCVKIMGIRDKLNKMFEIPKVSQ